MKERSGFTIVIAVVAMMGTVLYLAGILVFDAINKQLDANQYISSGDGGAPQFRLTRAADDVWELRRAAQLIGHATRVESDLSSVTFRVTDLASPADGALRAASGQFTLLLAQGEQLSCSECPHLSPSLPAVWHAGLKR